MQNNFTDKVIPLCDRIMRYAQSILLNTAEAEDTVQDVMEKLWKMKDTLPYEGNLQALVYTMTRNSCIDVIRRRKVRLHQQIDSVGAVVQAPDGMRDIELRDMKALVVAAISTLPEKQQLVIHLRDIECCEFAEISEITGIEEATARVLLSRARKAVREIMLKNREHEI